MALAELNPAFKSLTGRVGDLVAVKHSGGKIVLRKRPAAVKTPPSEAQLANQARVRNASAYGKSILADPEVGAPYRAAAKRLGKRPFNLAFRDFFRAPQIVEVDLSACTGKPGETLRIHATDDFEVVAVRVEIKGVGGAVLEEGEAVLDSDNVWFYTTRTQIAADTKIVASATAEDRPGNKAVKTQHWMTGSVA